MWQSVMTVLFESVMSMPSLLGVFQYGHIADDRVVASHKVKTAGGERIVFYVNNAQSAMPDK
jgi:hypothetical protein